MAIAEKEAEQKSYVTREDLRYEINWIRGRIDKLRKSLKLVVAALVDKKILGKEVAEVFTETAKEADEETVNWFLGKSKEGE